MINDYECPRCHNVFPSSNKMLHDARCTEEKPVPLNASRMEISQSFENKQEIIPKKEENFININEIKDYDPPKEENFPSVFYCDICHVSMPEDQKNDHIICHNLEEEEKKKIKKNRNNLNNFGISQREIDEQRKIERQIQRKNRQNQIHNNNNNHINNYNISDRNNINYNNDNNINNNHIRPENVVQRTNEYNYNSNNNNNHRRYNNGNNRVNRGPVITIRQTGPNSHTINYYQSDIRSNQNRVHRNNNFHFEPLQIRRHGNLHFNDFNDIFENVFSNVGSHHQHPTDKHILNELPETKIEDINKLDQEKRNCVICLEDFKNGDKATILPCIHLFHKNCIKSWLKAQNCCPICKFKLTRSNMNSQNNNF